MTFITFEGGDGAGKSTLIEKVSQYLTSQGHTVLVTREPGGCPLGVHVREILLHKKDLTIVPRAELLLFLADRAQHVEEVIKPALAKGQIVLCDRFNDSTIAYQGGARGLDEQAVRDLCAFASANLEPTLTIYLDIDPEIALKRITRAGDRMEKENIDFHQRIRSKFHQIAQREPKRFKLIDATPTPDVVFNHARELVNAVL